MQRGARPARPFSTFVQFVLLFFAPPAACQLCNDIGRSGASLAVIWRSTDTSSTTLSATKKSRQEVALTHRAVKLRSTSTCSSTHFFLHNLLGAAVLARSAF